MTNREYYKTIEVAQAGYDYYPNWNMSFEKWLYEEHVTEMPSLYGLNRGYPYYTATYEQALRYAEMIKKQK